MITAGDIFDLLNSLYPIHTACDFDNAGFLVGDRGREVKKALVCLDCGRLAADRAIADGYDLIITHHPLIWEGLKSVTADSIVYRLIRADVSVFSMHTNLDIAEGGVTDRLCEALGLSDIEVYTASDGFVLRSAKAGGISADALALKIKSSLKGSVRYVGKGAPIDRVLVCSVSGGSYLYEAAADGFDALITADVKHNLFIDAENLGIAVFDGGHYETERVVCEPLARLLAERFSDTVFHTFDPETIKSL